MNAKAKKATLIMALVAFAFFMDANNHKSDMQTNALQAGTFLGTGVKVEKSPCFMGTQVVTRTVVIFGVQVGDSWQTEESC
jgi:hypothetical protein